MNRLALLALLGLAACSGAPYSLAQGLEVAPDAGDVDAADPPDGGDASTASDAADAKTGDDARASDAAEDAAPTPTPCDMSTSQNRQKYLAEYNTIFTGHDGGSLADCSSGTCVDPAECCYNVIACVRR
jgi:hypothetical protein